MKGYVGWLGERERWEKQRQLVDPSRTRAEQTDKAGTTTSHHAVRESERIKGCRVKGVEQETVPRDPLRGICHAWQGHQAGT
jgi:hypothetical protein